MLINHLFYCFEREMIKTNILSINCALTREVLEEQYRYSIVTKREFDESGFYTHFKIPNDTRRLENDIKPFGNVQFNVNDLEYGVGCVLFIKDGILDFFECYTNAESLPAEIKCFSVKNK